MIKEEIKKIINKSIKELQKRGVFVKFEIPEILIEYQKEGTHGDYSSNIAMQLAKIIKNKPIDIAKLILESINKNPSKESFSNVEILIPGFINFFINPKYLQDQLIGVLRSGKGFGCFPVGNNKKTNVEFISANPTGPLTLGNGRGGFCGDVLANVLEKAGYNVTREYYINNRGEQIIKLGHSVIGDAEAVYKGQYIEELKGKTGGSQTSRYSVEEVGKEAAVSIFEKLIKPTIKRMSIRFDVWFSEEDMYQKGEVDEAIKEISEKGFTYQSEKALWFKCKELGDDKDRVLVRTDGIRTYFASDIAYLKNKINRGFEKIILFLGADHYGYVARLKAAAHVLGFDKENLDAIVMQLVRLAQNGEEVKMSKRSGTYVTLDELLDEVGLDVARFFFLQRSADTHLSFDLNLAKERSVKNPVYYIQYAYARICSIAKKAGILLRLKKPNFGLLKESQELELIKQLIKLPEIVEEIAKDYQIQRLPQYAIGLADAFHRFYENCRVIDRDKNISAARMGLIKATKIVLKNTLSLMGISSPEKM